MRESEFRVWDKQNKEMIFFPHKTRDLVFTDKGINFICFHRGVQLPLIENRELELNEYTGLKDKNGIKIYERDIVKDGNDISCVNDKIFYLLGLISTQPTNPTHKTIEVIGNIYANPDLIYDSN